MTTKITTNMIRIIATAVLMMLVLPETGKSQDNWIQRADFGGTVRIRAVGFSIGDKGYLGTGIDPFWRKDFWEYNPATDTWTQRADFGGTERHSAVGFSINNKGYIGTGFDGSRRKDFWEYNPTTNTWTQRAEFGGTGRSGAVGFSIGDKGYIGTGYDPSYRNDFWEYDPVTNIWTQRADFGGTARVFAVGFSISDKGYIGTGFDGSVRRNDFWEYYPSTNTWIQRADFGSTARREAVGFSIVDKGYIGTGDDGSNRKDFWEYDPVTNTWTQRADFGGTARRAAVGFSIGDKGYIGTGDDGSNRKDFWEYDPEKYPPDSPILSSPGDGEANISLNPTLSWHPALLAEDYHLQVSTESNFSTTIVDVSGIADTWYTVSELEYETQYFWRVRAENQYGTSDWSEVWSFTTHAEGPWTRKSDFGGTGRDRAVGFSIGDKGYIGTGYDPSSRKDFWEYDPATNIWTQRADFGGTARSSAVGFAIGDKGYIGTGFDPSFRNDFWEYNPATNTWTQRADFGGSARRYAVGFSIGDKGYIGTGFDGLRKKDFWEYDPVINTWTQRADFGGTGRQNAVGFSIGEKGYIGTGHDGSNRKDFWEYDPGNNTWTQRADFSGSERWDAIGISIGDKGYIGTGFDGLRKKDFWEYDPATNTWSQCADFGGTGRYAAIGFSIGDKGYIGTGHDSSNRKDFWEYDPAADLVYPVIVVTPGFFEETLNTGETSSQILTIENQGEGNLEFSITIEDTDGNGLPASVKIRDPRDGTVPPDGWETTSTGANVNWRLSETNRAGVDDILVFTYWLSADPVEGTVPPMGSVEIEVTFDASELDEGVYYANILVNSNDPATPEVVIPVELTVGEMQPPAPVVLAYPEDGATLEVEMGEEVTFAWYPSHPQVTNYQFEIALDADFNDIVYLNYEIADTFHVMIVDDETADGTYYWRVCAENAAGWGDYSDVRSFTLILVGVDDMDIPTVYSLMQNYPNPFNPSTRIRYGLPERSTVKLEIYNTLGQRVATLVNTELEAGYHDVEWYSGRTASGMYFYRLEAVSTDIPSNRFIEVRSMIKLK